MLFLPENVNHLGQVLSYLKDRASPLAVAPQSRGGLVLVNPHYSDLISAGSRLIWPQHFQCQAIYAIGSVFLCKVESAEARQQSLDNRIHMLALLGRILENFDPEQRACLLVNALCRKWGLSTVEKADLRLLGSLGRVTPEQMQGAIHRYKQHLQKLGQMARMGDEHHLSWQRKLMSIPQEVSVPPDDGNEERITSQFGRADILAALELPRQIAPLVEG
jgi:hypothetical protein